MLTDRLGLPAVGGGLFATLTERWDGKGEPAGTRGEEIPLAMRIAQVARDAALQRMLGGQEFAARSSASARAGRSTRHRRCWPTTRARSSPRCRRLDLGRDARAEPRPA